VRPVGPKHVLKLNNVRGRRYVVKIQRSNSIDVLEDPRKLPGHSLNLCVAETQAGQPGNVKYLLSLNHGGRF
jgi:hypothetical protein